MKAILEFNLPEDQVEFEEAVNGSKWQHVLWQVDQELRSKTKYATDQDHEERVKALYEIRDFLHDCKNEAGLKFN